MPYHRLQHHKHRSVESDQWVYPDLTNRYTARYEHRLSQHCTSTVYRSTVRVPSVVALAIKWEPSNIRNPTLILVCNYSGCTRPCEELLTDAIYHQHPNIPQHHRQPQPPRARTVYSNLGFDVLGNVLTEVYAAASPGSTRTSRTSRTYDQLILEEIIAPLEQENTGVKVSNAKPSTTFAKAYQCNEDGFDPANAACISPLQPCSDCMADFG